MEQTPNKGFRYWFKNIFWYHYGKLSLLVLFLVVTAVWLTVDALRKPSYDLNVAVAMDFAIARSDTDELAALFGAAAGDVNGDGKVLVNIMTVNLMDEENPESGMYQLLLYMSLPEYAVFLLDEKTSARYAEKDESFQPLADYGIGTDDQTGRRVWVGNKAVLRSWCGEDCYACLADWTVDGKGSREATEAAVRALQALLASESTADTAG